MDVDQIWRAIDHERAGLADLFDDLSPAEWSQPSLCSGWRVRDVAAHLTLAHTPARRAAVDLVRARGSFDRMIRDTAVRAAARPVGTFAPRLREMVGSRRTAPFLTPLEPLIDVLVHGQDVAVPLGRHRSMPVDAAVAAADRVWHLGMPFHARRRLAGVRPTATDAEWSAGDGPPVRGPMAELLLLMTGRPTTPGALTGAGVELLAQAGERSTR
jgi:uncharacterized protein (TIGR03083 family)